MSAVTDLSDQQDVVQGAVDAILCRGATLPSGAVAKLVEAFELVYPDLPGSAVSYLVVTAVGTSPFASDPTIAHEPPASLVRVRWSYANAGGTREFASVEQAALWVDLQLAGCPEMTIVREA